MSYINTNFYQNPEFYKGTDLDEPVPGWGLNPSAYANPRVGVGAVLAKSPLAIRAAVMNSALRAGTIDQPIDEASDIPWYYWVGGSAVIVGLAGFAYYKGWLG